MEECFNYKTQLRYRIYTLYSYQALTCLLYVTKTDIENDTVIFTSCSPDEAKLYDVELERGALDGLNFRKPDTSIDPT